MKSTTVKYRGASLAVYPYRHRSGKTYYRFDRKDGRQMARSTLEAAKSAAKEYLISIFRGGFDINDLDDGQVAICKSVLSMEMTMKQLDEFRVWRDRQMPRKNSKEAIREFLELKTANAGDSHKNVRTLTAHLKALPDMDLCDITIGKLPPLKGAARTRLNRRRAWITFFRWCVDQEYLWLAPGETKTAPQKLDKPIIGRKTPATWSVEEVIVLLKSVRESYLPWLVLTCFNGLRTEEVIPETGSLKSPLDWSDFDWEEMKIIVRAETAKTGRRRIIPINAVTASWLEPIAKTSGRVGPMTHPSKPSTAGNIGETTRLGRLVGGWKRNANRHSFISYRAAVLGSVYLAAREAGNSEAESKKSYEDVKSEREGKAWFACDKASICIMEVTEKSRHAIESV